GPQRLGRSLVAHVVLPDGVRSVRAGTTAGMAVRCARAARRGPPARLTVASAPVHDTSAPPPASTAGEAARMPIRGAANPTVAVARVARATPWWNRSPNSSGRPAGPVVTPRARSAV